MTLGTYFLFINLVSIFSSMITPQKLCLWQASFTISELPPLPSLDSGICARTSLLLVLTLVLVFTESHASYCFLCYTIHCLSLAMTFSHGFGLPIGKSFPSQYPWIHCYRKHECHSTGLGASQRLGCVSSVQLRSLQCPLCHVCSQTAYLHVARVWVLPLWSPSEDLRHTPQKYRWPWCFVFCPPLCLHCMNSFTETSVYHYQFLVHNWENPDTWKQVVDWFVSPHMSGK